MKFWKLFNLLAFLNFLYSNSEYIKNQDMKTISMKSIDGIIIHLTNKFITHKVYAKSLYLEVNFENINSVKPILEFYISERNLHCNLSKMHENEIIKDNTIYTNNCLIFMHITYKEHLKNIISLMVYLKQNTSAVGLIFICDNFLYENEIYNPHEELNYTLLEPLILTYIVSKDVMVPYKKEDFPYLTFELYWGIDNKTDIVHIDYNLDFGKYFNYYFFIYMKPIFFALTDYLTYNIQFTVHNNFTIEPQFCFIRDSSYCISKPDYINSNVVREVLEQQVRSLCIYENTLIDENENTKYDLIKYTANIEEKTNNENKRIEYISIENGNKEDFQMKGEVENKEDKEIVEMNKINETEKTHKDDEYIKLNEISETNKTAENNENIEKKNYNENNILIKGDESSIFKDVAEKSKINSESDIEIKNDVGITQKKEGEEKEEEKEEDKEKGDKEEVEEEQDGDDDDEGKEKRKKKDKTLNYMLKENTSENENEINKNDKKPTKRKKLFSKIFILYIHHLFGLIYDTNNKPSVDTNNSSKKCSNDILKLLGVSTEAVDECFLNNFHSYMQKMIKRKFYIYSISINGNTLKTRLNKDIAIRLICDAFRTMPQYCINYLKYMEELRTHKESKHINIHTFYFIIFTVIIHIIGSYLNFVVPDYLNNHK